MKRPNERPEKPTPTAQPPSRPAGMQTMDDELYRLVRDAIRQKRAA
jgi:hypothetical protein